VERVPDQPLARYNLGAALSRVGAMAEAREEFEQSSRLNPEDDMSYAGLGFCAETDGQLEEAQQFYETALTFNPENSYAREGLTRLTGSSGGVPLN
jgi:Flp pilus assembly protein TadD